MPPPAKRKRQDVVPTSSPEEDQDIESKSHEASSSPPILHETIASGKQRDGTRPKARATTANFPQNAAPIYLPARTTQRGKATIRPTSANTSPESKKKRKKVNGLEEQGKSGDIFTFFTKQAQRQQVERHGVTKKATVSGSQSALEVDDDVIEDGDDLFKAKASVIGQVAKKRAREVGSWSNGQTTQGPSASQKFVIQRPEPVKKFEEDLRPWAERFAPRDLEELIVHKKKVADVRSWLDSVINGRMRQRLLVLKGAAGTGKTTTVQLLAKDMKCEVLEWRNPVGAISTSDGLQSLTAQFEEFIGRGEKFGQLDIFGDGAVPSKPDNKPLDRRKQLILVEEFPNNLARSSTALQSFRSIILQYLASNTPPLSLAGLHHSSEPVTPVVMVISETLLGTASSSTDSFTAHRLLGPEILQHPGVGIIEFNDIAPTFLTKGLELVVQKESRKSGRRKTPGPAVLKALGDIGDIRSAIGSLEFLCLRGDVDGDWGAKVAFGKTKKGSKDTTLTKMESETLELVTRREASLGIFHAVGKVVYNKREEMVKPSKLEDLPDFLSAHSRPRKSDVQIDSLIDETGTDTQTFISAIHENYILSCAAPSTSFDASTLDHINGCAGFLSDADLLSPSFNLPSANSANDSTRQDELSFQLAVRGILFSLPYPVKRSAQNGKRDMHKLFYPTALRLWRQKEDIEASVDHWVTRLLKGEYVNSSTADDANSQRTGAGIVESWRSSRPAKPSIQSQHQMNNAPPPLAIGSSARKEMLLERLPYMVLIARARRTRLSNSRELQEMEKVTSFQGVGDPSEEELDGDQMGKEEEGPEDSKGRRGLVMRGKGTPTAGIAGLGALQEQKLVLSDDDIED